MTTDEGEGIAEGGRLFVIPGGLTDGERIWGDLEAVVGEEGHEGEESEQDRGGALDCERRPAAGSLEAEMGADLMEGGFNRPYTLHPYPQY